MKKLLLSAAIFGLAVTCAMADITTVTPLAFGGGVTEIGTDGPRGTVIYADTATSGWFTNQAGSAPADDCHAISGGTITAATFGYAGTSSGLPPGTSTFTATVAFYDNTFGDGVFGPLMGTYTVTGLPLVGGWVIGVTGLNIPVNADFWFQVSYPALGNALGPLITGNPGGPPPTMPGYSHDLFHKGATSLFWFGGSPWADFYHSVSIPEPGTIGLMVLVGLAALYRRR